MENPDCDPSGITAFISVYYRRNTGLGYAEKLARVSNAKTVTR